MDSSQNYKVLFICKNKPLQSFSLLLSQEEALRSDVSDVLMKGTKHFEKKHIASEITNFVDFTKNEIENQDDLFTTSQFAILPFYFNSKINRSKLCSQNSSNLSNQEMIQVQIIDNRKFESIAENYFMNADTALNEFIDDQEEIGMSKGLCVQGSSILKELKSKSRSRSRSDCVQIEIYPASNGGGLPSNNLNFIDFENSIPKEKNFSKNAPKYRSVTQGTNIEGICNNSSCSYVGKQVICKIGFGAVDLLNEDSRIVCPGCKVQIVPITCGFYNCIYFWSGMMKKDNKKVKCIATDQIAPPEKYTQYSPWNEDGSSSHVKWISLTIHSKIPQDSQQCIICQKSDGQEIKKCSNNHCYHENCLQSLKVTNCVCPACSAIST